MPLSEQEQRLLEEMERHLMRNDSDVVTAPTSGRSLSYRNLVYGALLLLAGIGGLVVGVVVGDVLGVIVGVIAFAAMVAGVMVAVRTSGPSGPEETRERVPHGGDRAPSESFMDRMNDRWDRRQEGL